MTPLKIGACLKTSEIADHRDWLFDAARDIELQDFMSHVALTTGSVSYTHLTLPTTPYV